MTSNFRDERHEKQGISIDEFYIYRSDPVSELIWTSVAETLFHLLPGLFGQELWYYEDLIAFGM